MCKIFILELCRLELFWYWFANEGKFKLIIAHIDIRWIESWVSRHFELDDDMMSGLAHTRSSMSHGSGTRHFRGSIYL